VGDLFATQDSVWGCGGKSLTIPWGFPLNFQRVASGGHLRWERGEGVAVSPPVDIINRGQEFFFRGIWLHR